MAIVFDYAAIKSRLDQLNGLKPSGRRFHEDGREYSQREYVEKLYRDLQDHIREQMIVDVSEFMIGGNAQQFVTWSAVGDYTDWSGHNGGTIEADDLEPVEDTRITAEDMRRQAAEAQSTELRRQHDAARMQHAYLQAVGTLLAERKHYAAQLVLVHPEAPVEPAAYQLCDADELRRFYGRPTGPRYVRR
jgi:hypothetical protein